MSFQELYQISSGGETDHLKSMLTKLQEENRKLRLEYEVTANSQPGIWLISFINNAHLSSSQLFRFLGNFPPTPPLS